MTSVSKPKDLTQQKLILMSRTRYFKKKSLKKVHETLSGGFICVFSPNLLIIKDCDLLLDEHV